MPARRILVSALLGLAGCSATPTGDRWERPADHTLPAASESLYCRDEARRQAAVRYPDQPPREERGIPRLEDQRRFPAEIQFYDQCMRRAGFVRVTAPAAG
jgi:hypothetical protein